MNPNKLKFRRMAKQSGPVTVAKASELSVMAWGELFNLARDRGVFRVGMNRAAVEAALSR